MPTAKRDSRIGTYKQHIDAMDLALVNPSGVQLTLPTHGQAMRFRQMCYQARRIIEREHGDSGWSEITISVDDNTVIIRTQESMVISIVPLDGVYVRSRFDPDPDRESTAEEKLANAKALLKGEPPRQLASIAMTDYHGVVTHPSNKRYAQKQVVLVPEVDINLEDIEREMTIDEPLDPSKPLFE